MVKWCALLMMIAMACAAPGDEEGLPCSQEFREAMARGDPSELIDCTAFMTCLGVAATELGLGVEALPGLPIADAVLGAQALETVRAWAAENCFIPCEQRQMCVALHYGRGRAVARMYPLDAYGTDDAPGWVEWSGVLTPEQLAFVRQFNRGHDLWLDASANEVAETELVWSTDRCRWGHPDCAEVRRALEEAERESRCGEVWSWNLRLCDPASAEYSDEYCRNSVQTLRETACER